MARRKDKKQKKGKKPFFGLIKPLFFSLIPIIGFLVVNYSSVQSIVQDFWHGTVFPQKPKLTTTDPIYLDPAGESSWATAEDGINDVNDGVLSSNPHTNVVVTDSSNKSSSVNESLQVPEEEQVTDLLGNSAPSSIEVNSWILDEGNASDFYSESDFSTHDMSQDITDLGFDEYLYYDDNGWNYLYDEQDISYDHVAFAIRAFIYNYSKPVRLNKLQTEVIDCKPIDKGIIDVEMAVVGDRLKFYALNNGWGTLENQSAEIYCSVDWAEIGFIKFQEYNFSLKPGEIFEFAEVIIDKGTFLNTLNKYDVHFVTVSAMSGNNACGNQLGYEADDDAFAFDILGSGPEDNLKSAEFLSVLNVDEAVNALQKSNRSYVRTYTSPSSFPQIDDTFAVETIIVPTKSCSITCRNIFDFGEFSLMTDTIDVTLYVPIYETKYIRTSGGEYGALISELAEMESPNNRAILQVANKYRYRAENFKIQDDEFDDW